MEKASPPVDLLPPPDPAATVRLGQLGAGLVVVVAVAGLAVDGVTNPATVLFATQPAAVPDAPTGPALLCTARLLLTGVGTLLAGVAVSRRPDRWATWALLAGAALLAGLIALPSHWDSGRLLGFLVAGVAWSFAAVQAVPTAYRPVAATVWIVFHFGGILCATTVPSATPWLTTQAWSRVYAPYLRAAYLSNAYHFYSPDPGPASLLYMLIRYEVDDPATGTTEMVSEWDVFPKRGQHMKDPLGLSYYRRLSLTEAASQALADAQTADTFNRLDATSARGQVAITGFSRPGADGKPEQVVIPIPPDEFEPRHTQYRVPDSLVSRNLLPSYARHQVHEKSAPGRRVVNVKMYRLEHRVIPPEYFVGTARTGRLDPFHPTTYRAYFLGDYDPAGKLVNPRDPLLYWLIPVLPKPGGAAPGDKEHVDYDDYLSKHAGFLVDWRRP